MDKTMTELVEELIGEHFHPLTTNKKEDAVVKMIRLLANGIDLISQDIEISGSVRG